MALPWEQFQKDAGNIGYSSSSTPVEDPILAWKGTTDGHDIYVTPIIAEDKVFILARGGKVHAYNRTTGEKIWETDTGMGTLQTSTPAYANGVLFVPANDLYNCGWIYALNASNGEQLWKASVTDGNFECPLTYYDGRLYIGEGLKGGLKDKSYYCYDENGTFLWSHTTNDTSGFLWDGAIIVGEYVVYPTYEGELISLNRTTGILQDQVDLTCDVSFSQSGLGRIRASSTYCDGYIYTTSETTFTSGYIWKVGYDPLNGTFIDEGWSVFRDFSTSTPVVYEGKVYVGQGEHGYPGDLSCLNVSTGDVIWSLPVSAGVKASPAVSLQNGKIYIYFTGAEPDSALYCATGDGELAWQFNPDNDTGYILQGAAICDEMVYFATGGGYVYCLEDHPHTAPETAFLANVTSGFDTLTVSFRDTSSAYPDQWRWDFGDGHSSTLHNPVHTYSEPGIYNVSLNTSNSYGTDVRTEYGYITIVPDWNPWNDPGSDKGRYVTIGELIAAYNCYCDNDPAPQTGANIDIGKLTEIYSAYTSKYPL